MLGEFKPWRSFDLWFQALEEFGPLIKMAPYKREPSNREALLLLTIGQGAVLAIG